MKRIMAILLAVLMLLGASAFAEGTAAVMTVDNINVSVPGQSIALDDLAASVALDSIGGAASIVDFGRTTTPISSSGQSHRTFSSRSRNS